MSSQKPENSGKKQDQDSKQGDKKMQPTPRIQSKEVHQPTEDNHQSDEPAKPAKVSKEKKDSDKTQISKANDADQGEDIFDNLDHEDHCEDHDQKPRKSQSFRDSIKKLLKKNNEEEEDLNFNDTEKSIYMYNQEQKDKKSYPDLKRFLFYKQLGVNPDQFRQIQLDALQKTDWTCPKIFAWKESSIILIIKEGREDKDKGYKRGRYFEIRDWDFNEIFFSERGNDPRRWYQFEEMWVMPYMFKDNKELKVITCNITTKEAKNYEVKLQKASEFEHFREVRLFEHKGQLMLFLTIRLKGKQEKFVLELAYLQDDCFKSVHLADVTSRNLNPSFKQIGSKVYYYYLEGDPKKPYVPALEIKYFDILSQEFEVYREKENFESKVFKVTPFGKGPKINEYYEFRNISRVHFIDPVDPDVQLDIEQYFVMLELDDHDVGLKFRSLRRLNKINNQLILLKTTTEYDWFDYRLATNYWMISQVKKENADVQVFYNEREAKKEFLDGDLGKAKVLFKFNKPVKFKGDEQFYSKCQQKAEEELLNDCVILVKFNVSDRFKDDPEKWLKTCALRIVDDKGNKFVKEGIEGTIQQYRRQDPESVNQFESIKRDMDICSWHHGVRYTVVEKDENGEIQTRWENKRLKSYESWENDEEWNKRKTAQQIYQIFRNLDNDGGWETSIGVLEDRINNVVKVVHAQDHRVDPTHKRIKWYEYDHVYTNYDIKIEESDFEQIDEFKENDSVQIEHLKIHTIENKDINLKHLWIEYGKKKEYLKTYMKCDQFVVTNKQKDCISIQIFTPIGYFALIKEYKIEYKSNDHNFAPVFKQVGCRFLICGFKMKGSMKLGVRKQNQRDETFLRDQDSGDILVLKNQNNIKYKFDQRNIKSTFYYYTKNSCKKYLMIDMKFCCQTQMDKMFKELDDHQIDLIYSNLITVILNMKPKKTNEECWGSQENIADFDVFQHREDLNGLSYATVLSQQPKLFSQMLKLDQIHHTQKSLADIFSELTNREFNDKELLKDQNTAFIEPIQIRKAKNISIGLDFRSPLQHCLYRGMQDLSSATVVIQESIMHMKDIASQNHQMAIQMLIPSIIFHPLGNVCEETVYLLYQYDQGEDISSFFEELEEDSLPAYFDFDFMLVPIPKFEIINAGKQKSKSQDDSHHHLDYRSKDTQSAELAEKQIDTNKATDKYCRTYKMNKEFFNINIVLRKYDEIPDKLIFNHDTPYTKYESGLLLSAIIDQFGTHIESLSQVRSMIDYKFETKTKRFFQIQQICFFCFIVIPFLAIVQLPRTSDWILTWLIIAQISHVFFIVIEFINMQIQGVKDYIKDLSNIADYSMFVLHTIYFILKKRDYDIAIESKVKIEDFTNDLQNTILIFEVLLLLSFVARTQHIIKVYKEYGRLTVLITMSIMKVIPFMVIFIVWNVLFAFQLYVLRSNEDDAKGYTGCMTAIGYFWVTFQNGVGNINPPTVDKWMIKKGKDMELVGGTANFIVWLIYFVWFMNQCILFITMLNFVIALISDVYEMVMDHKMVHEYAQKQQLNDETDRFFMFWENLRKKEKVMIEDHIGQEILISSGKRVFDEDEWDGLIKTLKKFVREAIIERFKELENDIVGNQSMLKEDVARLFKSQTLGVESLKKEFKELTEICEDIQKVKRDKDPAYQALEIVKEIKTLVKRMEKLRIEIQEEQKDEIHIQNLIQEINAKIGKQ